jgi:carbonic anhydrase
MSSSFPTESFADVLTANERFAANFVHDGRSGRAARQLAVVTCMDSRIDPLAALGLERGDVKILRNAGARVTEDVLRTLVLAVYLLGVKRVLVMPHTDCRMVSATEDEIHAEIFEMYGMDTRSLEIRTMADQHAALIQDVTRIKASPFLPDDVVVGGAIYDVRSGRLTPTT